MKEYKNYGCLVFAGLLLAVMHSCKPAAAPQPLFDHVVVVISDDHVFKAAGCYGNELIRTPNIDRLAAEGIRFTRAYANAPICSASRQSLLTGKYPHATGVNLLFTPFNDDVNRTVAEHLEERGFATAMIGKTHWNDWIYGNFWEEWPDFGFDTVITRAQWQGYLRQHPPRPVPDSIPTRSNTPHEENISWQKNAQMLPSAYYDQDSEGTFLAQSAIRFMREHADERFFLWLAFHEPHAPFNFPVEFAAGYDPALVPLPEGSEEDQRWVPRIFRDLSEQERRGIIASYYSSVEYMDKNLGLVMDELEASGLQDRTLVVYLSDHGYLLNEHDRFEKHTMWEESLLTPFIIRGSGLEKGKQVDALVEFVDLVPTLFEALGVEAHDDLQGQSLFPLIEGTRSSLRAYAFSEYLEDNMAMVASKKWKYIFTTGKRDLGLGYATGRGPSGVVHMLYDLEDDPRESRNLAYEADHAILVDSLQEVMLQHFISTHPDAAELPSGLNRVGQLIWFCEPRDVGEEPGSELQRIFEKDKIYE